MAGDTVITVIGNLTADPELRWTQSGARSPISRWPPPPEPTTVTPVSGATATPSSCAAPCGARPLRTSPSRCVRACASSFRVASPSARTTPSRVNVARSLSCRSTRSAPPCAAHARRSPAPPPPVAAATSPTTAASSRAATSRQPPQGGGYGGGQGGYGQGGANYGAPTGGSPEDPWRSAPAGGATSFGDEPPF